MCGIAGLWDSPHDAGEINARLEAMRDALAHRGPDASGIHPFPGGGFAHTRLAVIDCSAAANQPFVWEDGHLLAYNGEIYNYRELRHELEGLGARFHTSSDTEVLAAALAQWGTDALPRLNGIFAFAWYNAVENSLLLARDRLGVKPLFWTRPEAGFAYASELGALKAAGFCGADISREALDAYLRLQYIPAPLTIFEGVHKLLPGHWMRLTGDHVEYQPYWQLRYQIDPAWTLDIAAGRFRELLEDSVRMQRVADVPLGAFLSGGIDSSVVCAALAQQCTEPLNTFTIGFEESKADERPYARAMAARINARHHETLAQPELFTLLPEMVKHFGEPFADSSALPTWVVSAAARQHVTVALSGDGGDELFAGYTWLHRSLLVERLKRIPWRWRHAVISALAAAPEAARLRQLQRLLADTKLSARAIFARRITMFSHEQRRALMGQGNPQWDPILRAWQRVGSNDDLECMLGADMLLYLPDDILTKVDRMSMAHGLEVRVPLLDHRIVEFAATVPFGLKYAAGQSKLLVKHAFRDQLPPALLRQRKRGFALPIDAWFRGTLGETFREKILEGAPRLAHLIAMRPVHELFTQHQHHRDNHGHKLWALLVLEEWLRQQS